MDKNKDILKSNIFDIGTGNAASVAFDLKNIREARTRITFYQQLSGRIVLLMKQLVLEFEETYQNSKPPLRLKIRQDGHLAWRIVNVSANEQKYVDIAGNDVFRNIPEITKYDFFDFDQKRLLLNMQYSINKHILKTLKLWINKEKARRDEAGL